MAARTGSTPTGPSSREARQRLKRGGALAVEIGKDQSLAVKALFAKAGLVDVASEKDLAGLDRVVVGHHS